MDKDSFNHGMICGLQTAARIMQESPTKYATYAAIDGAILALENVSKKAKDE